MSVGIVGLGRMGSVIAERLGRTHALLGWGVRAEATVANLREQNVAAHLEVVEVARGKVNRG